MKTTAALLWFYVERGRIRTQAGHDAAKFEALVMDPSLAREALARFPDDPDLYAQLCALLEGEIILARRGVFLIDDPPTDK